MISTKTGLPDPKARAADTVSGVDDDEGRPYKAGKWRWAEILPPMFFQEQLEHTHAARRDHTFDRRVELPSEG